MEIEEMSENQCRALLERSTIGRLGCSLEDQPYVLPVYFACEAEHIYVLSTLGQKIKWMRANPKVCMEIDEIASQSQWESVVVNGRYRELSEPLDEVEVSRARKLLGTRHRWWINALAERRTQTDDDLSIAPLFFSIDIESLIGLRASAGEERGASPK